MSKSRIEFIADLLDSNKLDASHKEKFLALTVQELRNQGATEAEIRERLDSLENVVTMLKAPSNTAPANNNPKADSLKHTPKKTVEALKLFDTSLKYFTHKWDREGEEFDRKKEVEKALEIVSSIQVPAKLKQRITSFISERPHKKKDDDPEWFVNYLFGKTFNCDYSWDNEKFINWYNNSISKDITAQEINDNMIEPFKHSIQIRDRRLKDHINPLVERVLYTEDGKTEFDVQTVNLEQAKFYTNTQELMGGIKKILEESVLKYAKINDRYKVRIEYSDVDRTLKIIHLKSKCPYSAHNPDLLGGSFKEIRDDYFISLCNWSVEAAFADGNKRLNILQDDMKKPMVENLDYTPEGFTHILYFY